ncbi:MAG: cbb3-type cytochrome c oxidase N-terminal domain-containing protein [Bacteroidota bacterium]
MAKYLLAGESINWLALFSLLTFVIIFVMALVLAFGRNRRRFDRIANLPLEDGSIASDQMNPPHIAAKDAGFSANGTTANRGGLNLRKYKMTILFLLTTASLSAQAEAAAEATSVAKMGLWESMNTPEKLLVVFCILMIAGAIYSLIHLNSSLMHIQKMRLLEKYAPEQLEALNIEAPVIQQESYWQRFYQRWTKSVPVEQEADIMLDHNYDGIRELDNSLPPWWLATFYAAVIFAPIYIWFVHFSPYGQSNAEQYLAEMAQAEEDVAAYLATQANAVDETNVVALIQAEALESGHSVFTTKCALCHGQLGEGGIGPNLTDDYWVHGGSISDIFSTIKYGVIEKGMQPWKKELRPLQIQEVASYILTLRGTDPPNQKDAEGELYVPELPEPAANDSLQTEESLSR